MPFELIGTGAVAVLYAEGTTVLNGIELTTISNPKTATAETTAEP